MKGLGVRELVGLGVLAVALLIGFVYRDPASSESRTTPPGEIHLGTTPTPTPVAPTPAPTPTPTPRAVPLGAPTGGWIIGIYQDAFSGGSILVAQTASSKLDLAYTAGPFLDVKDDAWSVRAEASYTLAPGRYALVLEYEGRLTVTVNDLPALAEEATGGAKVVRAVFEHTGGTAGIRIDARDVKGPFRLKAVE